MSQEAELQLVDIANQDAAIPILERQVRLWPGLVAEWERIGPVAVMSKGYPEHRLSLILDSGDATIRPGQVLLSPAFTPASYRWSGEIEVISLLFTPDWLCQIGAEIGIKQPSHLELRGSIEPKDEFLTGLLGAFQKEVLMPGIGSRLLIDSLSQALAVYLIRRYTDRQLTAGQPLVIPKWRIRRAQDFIRENLNNGISLKEIADAAGDVSPYHFSRLFKKATGFSPYQFLIECRVLAAQQLLRAQRGLSLGEIAFRCGFADQSSFTRCFRQRTGLTPKQYRDG
ncbi:MAG: helix-turn-helix transcriptional regulator [Verrucomicrobia bacterium]|nr:helix-turn-helix transcriptional regulator [Verrucomicrobiota bacterium]